MAPTQNASDPAEPALHVVCTVAENSYFCGVAALANSLVAAGFAGTLVVGYRGSLPNWLSSHEQGRAPGLFKITEAVTLKLLQVPGEWHLNNCKPLFIKRVLAEVAPAAELVYYFDTDIVIRHCWNDFVEWASLGLVVVLDVADSYMPPSHIHRRAWQALAAKRGLACRDFTGYVNGGCIGIARAYAEFATVWSALMEELESGGADMRKMKHGSPNMAFSRMDQDVLNAALMATDFPVASMGSEAMGMFPWTGEVMCHAMWHGKPWARNYIADALRGFPPDRMHRAYWDFVDGPIRPFAPSTLRRKRLELATAHFIGLVHSRSYRDT